MGTKNNQIDFTNQTILVGIDTHKKSWKINLRHCQMELKSFSMDPSVEQLNGYLRKNYPGAKYKSVYEAGFCGYGIHRKLIQAGIENIVVNPGDVPTRNKERGYRTDKIDSRKLSRELENGSITGIYIPSEQQEELRSLSRLRQQLVKDQSRVKNRIKGMLLYYGKDIPEHYEISHWSRNFINYLHSIEFTTLSAKECLEIYITDLNDKRGKIYTVTKKLRSFVKENPHQQIIKNLCSVPGVGFLTAVTLYTELMDMNRFDNTDQLCCYVGLTPSVISSADKEKVLGITRRQNKYLRNMLIESTWTAVRNDPALTEKFGKLSFRMSKQKAIIRIAKKLLCRIRFVWKNNTLYKFGNK